MGKFFNLFVYFTLFLPNITYAQLNISISSKPAPRCSNAMRSHVFPKAKMANAVCRPEVYKSKERRVRYALKRIKRWRKYAQLKWNEEHNDIYKRPTGVMKPPLYPTYSYDRAVVYMYTEWAHECGQFNGKLADALLELSHLNERCEDTVAYESLRRMWRDNKQVQDIYKNYGGSPTHNSPRGVASEQNNLRSR